jgi:hypothetical protein
MTRLVFSGIRNGQLVRVAWQDGALSGDPECCMWIRYLARVLEGRVVGPIGGPYSSSDHLQDPYAASEIIKSIFPGKVQVMGDLPLRLAPKGAIH